MLIRWFYARRHRWDRKNEETEEYLILPWHQKGNGHLQLGTKLKATQLKSQGGSSFPTNGHTAILNKLNSKSKPNRKRMNIDN